MQLERVGTVTVRSVLFQVLGEIDNVNGFEWTLFDTDTATL